jgi:hypothetical protein
MPAPRPAQCCSRRSRTRKACTAGSAAATARRDPRRSRHDLADLVEPDLDVAARDSFKSFRALLEDGGLPLHVRRDAQALEQFKQVNADRSAGGRIVVADRFRGLHRPLERVDRRDVRPWRSLAHEHTDADLGEVDPALRHDPGLTYQRVDLRSRDDDHVGGFALEDTIGHGPDRSVEIGAYPVSRRPLESRDELGHDRRHGRAGDDLDIRRGRHGAAADDRSDERVSEIPDIHVTSSRGIAQWNFKSLQDMAWSARCLHSRNAAASFHWDRS